jgi:hypothetical protein
LSRLTDGAGADDVICAVGIATVQYRGSFTIRPHNGGTLATVVLDDSELRQDAYTAMA